MIPAEARGAWREIEARLRPFIARRVVSADVDDVLQEILVRVYKGLPSLREGDRFGGWVYRIAERVLADAANRRRRVAVPVPDLDAESGPTVDEEAADLQLELGACVALFVARLPSPYREAVTLTELQGLTQKQAADLAGVSLSGMKSRVQRGRARIRSMFEACCEISVDCRGRIVQCDARDSQRTPEDCRTGAGPQRSGT